MLNIGSVINFRGHNFKIIGSSSSDTYNGTKLFLECESWRNGNGLSTIQAFFDQRESRMNAYRFEVEKVIYNYPATIVLWKDGTKTVVKCSDKDYYDKLTGFLMCLAKKAYGNTGRFNDVIREHVPENTFIRAAREFIEFLNGLFKNH